MVPPSQLVLNIFFFCDVLGSKKKQQKIDLNFFENISFLKERYFFIFRMHFFLLLPKTSRKNSKRLFNDNQVSYGGTTLVNVRPRLDRVLKTRVIKCCLKLYYRSLV